MKQRPAFEPIPELLRPQNCAGYIAPTALLPRPCGEPCPDPAVWYSIETGFPLCEAHKQALEKIQRQAEITPP